ncbi:toluene tolerance protein [Chromohalobacter japonicus]|uniref:Toluene tolerance protein n=2 Tax=Chromohalobacter TaxID=42054 RepID=A0A1Q8TAL2_9GAMM|nr:MULTISPECIES: ABC transporter substrate-binding protein [Chromohalobacter]MCT8469511.1 ABC transporter substrate-binding protein [Chromohalobacter canadensis]MCT8472135.1 ABC transporter substrate-binding protein [Chromohalobacter canadensis]MCT8499753.1 ABC transporter substrate-binding protein [Chromohalobacter canadensis]OLO10714.1 toluene tolerance protein [Chromohalobacter japonicus]SOC55458.1 phospholipid transport system substrate-binding protein [Chromohalobacter canadensis]
MTSRQFTPRRSSLCALLLSVLWCVAFTAQAQQAPQQLIEDNVAALMQKLDGRKDYYAEHESELESLVDDSLDDVADFRYIGASVMGRYFSNASPEQRSRFVDTFRKTLIETYAKGLVTFDYRDIRVLDNDSEQRYEDQASVDMEVVSTNGDVYPVVYTLHQRDGEWRVINVIVNGINLGLTFRNQFDQAMRDNNRDIDAVIDGWAPDVATDELEAGGDDDQ